MNHNPVKCHRSRISNEPQYLDKKESNQSTRINVKTKRNPIRQWTEQRFAKGYMGTDFLVNNEIFKYDLSKTFFFIFFYLQKHILIY